MNTRGAVGEEDSQVALSQRQMNRLGRQLEQDLIQEPVPYLLKLVCNHSKGLEDGIGRACDGDDSLGAVSL